MAQGILTPTVQIARHPIHPMLVVFPIACFVGTLLADIAYLWTAQMLWSDFAAWLVSAGVILGFIAAIAGAIDFFGNRAIRALSPAWLHALGNLVVLILAILNMLVHTHDGWTSVWPWGIALSSAVVLILLFTGWMGWSMVYRYGVGIAP
jgi:uncharacterized membrane protein